MSMNIYRGKRGQITIFIIIAIMIVVMGILIYVFYPEVSGAFTSETQNPNEYIQRCLEESLQENVEEISLQGGSLEPGHYIMYNNEKVEYLCYTGMYYKTCTVQQPLLRAHIESEIKNSIEQIAEVCFTDMQESYRDQGYEVGFHPGDMKVELMPKKILVSFNHTLSLNKEEPLRYNHFNVILNNNLYELVSIANSIIKWETVYGDAETTTYMNYYPHIKVEKKKMSDGSTIYILSERETTNKLQFASRSVAWPPGAASLQ